MIRDGGTMCVAFAILFSIGTLKFATVTFGQADSALEAFVERTESVRAELIAVRHDIHRHPEVSGSEKRTAALVAQRLNALGWEVEEGVGGYGVVASLRGSLPGERIVAFRADMDAVRSNAPDPVEYRSKKPGIRHICGHDVHTAIALALAEGFSSIRDRIPGTVMLVFQPAEENATGARAMLADGAFASVKPDAIFAVHTAPFEVGQAATTAGGMMASRDRLTVTVSGQGNISEVVGRVRSEIMAVNTVNREEAFRGVPRESVFIQMQAASSGGTKRVVRANIMLADDDVRQRVKETLTTNLTELETEQVDVEVDYESKWVAGVTNDPKITARAIAAAEAILGPGNVLPLTSIVPAFSEDFGSFQEHVPGTMFFLGVSNGAQGWVGMPHSPNYVADDEAVLVGAGAMAAVMLDALRMD